MNLLLRILMIAIGACLLCNQAVLAASINHAESVELQKLSFDAEPDEIAVSINQAESIELTGRFYQADGEKPPETLIGLTDWLVKLHEVKRVDQTGGSYWFYTELINDSANSKWVLEPGNRLVEKIEVSVFAQDSSVQHFASGYLEDHDYLLHYGRAIHLPEGARIAVLIRFQTPYYPSMPQVRLYSEPAYHHLVFVENFWVLAAMGALIALALYNLFIGFITRDRALLYYAAYLADYFIAWAFTFQLPAELFGWHDLHPHYIWFFLLPVLGTLFYTDFLELKSNFPTLAKISRINIILPLILLPSCFVALPYAHLLATVVITLWISLALTCGIASLMSGFLPARYFVAAFSALLIPGLIILPANFGLIPELVRNAELLTLLGGTLDGMLLAFALAYKIKLMSEEKAQAWQQADTQEQLNKLLEQHLQERNEQNERLLKNEETLIVLRDAALAANQAKSAFLANMSHEVRTPMNSILGMTQLALNKTTSDQVRNYLEKIHLSGLHLLGIIDDVLDFSKVSENKLMLEELDFELDELLYNTRVLFEQSINEKGLSLDVSVDSDIPVCLRGDPLRLGQVLINFLSNAVKFTKKGGVAIRVKKLDENKNGLLLRFEIQDEGIGISDEAKSRLFQPFEQADSSTTRVYGGTGLGLSICKKLVELMDDGEIGVDSSRGKGSTFWFTVRLPKGSLKPAVVADVGAAMVPQLNGVYILLADDHPFNCEVAAGFLEHAGAIVCIAHNGQEALDLLKWQRFDCVLMDIQMPVMDGSEAIKLIRANPVWADLPVIALTAMTSNEDYKRYLDAGMDDFIGKPFNPSVLCSTIAKWVRSSPPSSSVTSPVTESSDVINLSELANLIVDNPVKQREFADNFVRFAQLDMEQIDAKLEHADFAAIASLAHHASSPAGMVGAIGLANLCRALEEQCKNGSDITQVRNTVSQMHAMMARIIEKIDTELCAPQQ